MCCVYPSTHSIKAAPLLLRNRCYEKQEHRTLLGLDKKYLFDHNEHLKKETVIIIFFCTYTFIKTLASTN